MLCLTERSNKRINALNEEITNLFTEVIESNEIEVCVISFSDLPHLVLPLRTIDSQIQWELLKADGKTGVAKVLKFFNERYVYR